MEKFCFLIQLFPKLINMKVLSFYDIFAQVLYLTDLYLDLYLNNIFIEVYIIYSFLIYFRYLFIETFYTVLKHYHFYVYISSSISLLKAVILYFNRKFMTNILFIYSSKFYTQLKMQC